VEVTIAACLFLNRLHNRVGKTLKQHISGQVNQIMARRARNTYYSDGRAGCCPADAAWGLEGHCTSTLAKWLCRAGADGSYVKAGADLSEFTGVPVDARQVERVVQRRGPAVRPWREQLPQERPALPPGKFCLS
jgi:hypothetical protein